MTAHLYRAYTTRRIGSYVAAETHIEFKSSLQDVTRQVPIIYCHGLLGTANDMRKTSTAIRLLAIAERAGPVFAGDIGGLVTWGNDTVVAAGGRIDQLVTFAGTLGCRTDKVFVGGESMGSVAALNWAWRNPTKVAGIWVRAPITRMQETHNRLLGHPTLSGIPASMEAAYTNIAGLTAAYPTHDPADPANITAQGVLRSLAGRTRMDATSEDEIVLSTEPILYARTYPGVHLHIRPGDHASNLDTPIEDVADWIATTIRANS